MFQIGRELLLREYDNADEEFCFMDIFGYTHGGECCEIEVKVADYDFHKEWKKPSKLAKHAQYWGVAKNQTDNFAPNIFYFFTLSNIEGLVLKRLDELKVPYGLITYNSLKDTFEIVRKAQKIHTRKYQGEVLSFDEDFKDYKHKRSKYG